MILKHITKDVCSCGAVATQDSRTFYGGIEREDRRFACGMAIYWSRIAKESRTVPCPHSNAEVARRAKLTIAMRSLMVAVNALDIGDADKASARSRLRELAIRNWDIKNPYPEGDP